MKQYIYSLSHPITKKIVYIGKKILKKDFWIIVDIQK
jgi:hypothetical protein